MQILEHVYYSTQQIIVISIRPRYRNHPKTMTPLHPRQSCHEMYQPTLQLLLIERAHVLNRCARRFARSKHPEIACSQCLMQLVRLLDEVHDDDEWVFETRGGDDGHQRVRHRLAAPFLYGHLHKYTK